MPALLWWMILLLVLPVDRMPAPDMADLDRKGTHVIGRECSAHLSKWHILNYGILESMLFGPNLWHIYEYLGLDWIREILAERHRQTTWVSLVCVCARDVSCSSIQMVRMINWCADVRVNVLHT